MGKYPEFVVGCLDIKNEKKLFDKFNSIVISILQRFTHIICLGFTQGAFGNISGEISAGYLDDFLFLKEENFHIINFKV